MQKMCEQTAKVVQKMCEAHQKVVQKMWFCIYFLLTFNKKHVTLFSKKKTACYESEFQT